MGPAVSSKASAVADTDAPSPTPTIGPSRTAARRTWAARRPTIRRVRSSGPTIVGREVDRIESVASAQRVARRDLAVVASTMRISTIPSARARFSSFETCGRVTPMSSAIAFWVSPSS